MNDVVAELPPPDEEDSDDDTDEDVDEEDVFSARALTNPLAVLDEINREISVKDDDIKLSKAILEKVFLSSFFLFPSFLFQNLIFRESFSSTLSAA